MRLRNFSINASIAAFSTLLMLLAAEAGIRLANPQYLNGTWREVSPKGYMMNKAGWTARHQFGERVVHYRFNDLHFRGPAVDHHRFKALVLGDSYTMGCLLDEDKTYVGLLQRRADRQFGNGTIQVLNGGMGGGGLADFWDYLSDFGDLIRPDMVILYFNTDDIGRSLNRMKYHNPGSPLMGFKKLVEYSTGYQWLLEHSHLAQWTRNKLVNMSMRDIQREAATDPRAVPGTTVEGVPVEAAIALADSLVLNIKRWCDARDLDFVVLTTGFHFDFYYGNLAVDDPEVAFLKKGHRFFADHRIPFNEITPRIATMAGSRLRDYVIEGDGHPNERGARAIAAGSWEVLQPAIHKALIRHGRWAGYVAAGDHLDALR